MERKDEVISIARMLFLAGVTVAQVPRSSKFHAWSTFRLEVSEKMVKIMKEGQVVDTTSRNLYLENENKQFLQTIKELNRQLNELFKSRSQATSKSKSKPDSESFDYAGWTRRIEAQERRMDVHLGKHV